jgi:hypothetical protein
MQRVTLIVVFAACSHAPPPPAKAAAAGPSSCEHVSDHLVSLMSASSVATDTEMDPVRRVIVRHCEQDLWTPRIQQCLLEAGTLQESDRCEGLLTPSQQQALSTEFRAAPAPAAAAPAPAAAPSPKAAGDPCDGGE